MKQEYPIEETWVSYEIHPERPPAGESAEKRFGRERYNSMMTALRSRGKDLGIEFCERPILANSRLAIEAAEYAREKGKLPEFGEKMFNAYFSQGLNIGELENVLNVASDAGLDRDEVRSALENGKYAPPRMQAAEAAGRLGIDSVPTFIINDRHRLVGAQPIEVFRSLFEQMKKE